MKKIIIISDSHGYMDNVRKIFQKETNVDIVIHLGDILGQNEELKDICKCKTVVVKGNCDIVTENKAFEIVEVGHNKIFATHGHDYGVDYNIDTLCSVAESNGCNIAMYGHTHVPDNSIYKGMYVVNPGSVSRPRQLNRKPTYGVMKVDAEGKTDIRIQYV